MKKVGIDVGSTTIKCVVLNEENQVIYKDYQRHFSLIRTKVKEVLETVAHTYSEEKLAVCISGSAGMGIAKKLNVPFIQEVCATSLAVKCKMTDVDVVIELGGEDAKILFLQGGLEVRMNGSCAGGTGAFIDQMAMLLDVKIGEMNQLAEKHEKVYQIASRCGVFAKSDIQPLLNQGATKEDVAASIFYAVVHQTISGLAQGRKIEGNVLYLGGPLTFFPELRKSFDDILGLEGNCPEDSLYYVAMGAAFATEDQDNGKQNNLGFKIENLLSKLENFDTKEGVTHCQPLFHDKKEYEEFSTRHKKNSERIHFVEETKGDIYMGVDVGSTTVKAVLIDAKGDILYQKYIQNNGDPVGLIKKFLLEMYEKYPDNIIISSAVTGYGEELIKNAFGMDYGIVETIAHYMAAKQFEPDLDFIIDIGGQDIKCFKIRNGAIENIFLNEACSSGCGSFLQTFAATMHYDIEEFVKLGLFAENPVDLGSRCTVFMNSSVKQAQKEGESIENISAGLSSSVVKNAIYKVIRITCADSLGKNIVVQGGTFLNDAVLRAFEQELGRNVIRPGIAGLMGAYGAALYAMDKHQKEETSTLISREKLNGFQHNVQSVNCNGCTNKCHLTVNTFSGGGRFIGGNRCEKPVTGNSEKQKDIYAYKILLQEKYRSLNVNANRETIGIPLGLNIYELLPFWHTLFTTLGFQVKVSPLSDKNLYNKGQHTIPSDTVCYPAKLLHGHIEALLEEKVDSIFYPCMGNNIDEGLGDEHFNCPVVAYYPDVIENNVNDLKNIKFINDPVDLNNRRNFTKQIYGILNRNFENIKKRDVKIAVDVAFKEYDSYMEAVRAKAKEYLKYAKDNQMPVMVLVGRPYHLDPEINHGINQLICSMGAVVVSEDSVSDQVGNVTTSVLNQWTYHSRLYAASRFVADSSKQHKINLVQLVSFGCGLDAITTDEIRNILECGGKIYTQLKIDEINNLGAAKIRLRSLLAAIE
jgi:predicted CoA-substrate-specific enzyme activase